MPPEQIFEEKKPVKNFYKFLSIVFLILIAGLAVTSFFFFKNQTLSYTINLPITPDGIKIEFSYGAQESLSNQNFFQKVKDQFVTEKADFIEADLSKMVLKVYKFGELSTEVPILTKGRDGSWWETPAGLYKINTKSENHFSSIGHVWMPWAMQFQGNFFIHGETYYADGTPTSSQYSGGCIRLKTEDAEKIYSLVEKGTPLLVFEESFSSDDFSYEKIKSIEINANSYLAVDILNNHIFAKKNHDQQVPVASITKLMTALVATEYINLDKYATVSPEDLIFTSKPRFNEGQQYTIYQLLFPLLLESSNEAAEIIARHYGRDAFIKHMNTKADSIGMYNTNFADPSGASEENISTAEDLFMLAKYIYNNRSFIFDITSENINDQIYGFNGFIDLENLNYFTDNEHYFGGKNGKTTVAQETNLSVFKIPINNTERPIVFITLGSENVEFETQILIDSVFEDLEIK